MYERKIYTIYWDGNNHEDALTALVLVPHWCACFPEHKLDG